ncbi:MAG TPA: branched-chain amino acid ABC transporter permease [Thermodesulfobacteriota bacterium]
MAPRDTLTGPANRRSFVLRAVPVGGFLLVFLAALPLALPMALAVDIVILAVAAVAFNMMLGYAGMLSFGQAAFFAIGGYTAGFLLKTFAVSALPALAAAAIVAAAGAAVVAWLTARLRDVYFILMTLAFAQLVYFIAMSWRGVTGGPSGLSGFDRPALDLLVASIPLSGATGFYVFASAVFLVVFGVFFALVHSPVGLVMKAMKENPDRLEAVGYPVGRYRFFTFTVSGAMTGIAGALYAFQWQLVPVTVASMNHSAAIVFMSILGGTGHPLGPVVGAAVYTWLSDVISTYWARWPIIFGLFIIIVVYFLRGGIAGGVQLVLHALAARLRRPSTGPLPPSDTR